MSKLRRKRNIRIQQNHLETNRDIERLQRNEEKFSEAKENFEKSTKTANKTMKKLFIERYNQVNPVVISLITQFKETFTVQAEKFSIFENLKAVFRKYKFDAQKKRKMAKFASTSFCSLAGSPESTNFWKKSLKQKKKRKRSKKKLNKREVEENQPIKAFRSQEALKKMINQNFQEMQSIHMKTKNNQNQSLQIPFQQQKFDTSQYESSSNNPFSEEIQQQFQKKEYHSRNVNVLVSPRNDQHYRKKVAQRKVKKKEGGKQRNSLQVRQKQEKIQKFSTLQQFQGFDSSNQEKQKEESKEYQNEIQRTIQWTRKQLQRQNRIDNMFLQQAQTIQPQQNNPYANLPKRRSIQNIALHPKIDLTAFTNFDLPSHTKTTQYKKQSGSLTHRNSQPQPMSFQTQQFVFTQTKQPQQKQFQTQALMSTNRLHQTVVMNDKDLFDFDMFNDAPKKSTKKEFIVQSIQKDDAEDSPGINLLDM